MQPDSEGARWVRLFKAPRACWKGASFERLTPRGQYLYDRSLERYKAKGGVEFPLRGELGTIENFRFIISPSEVHD